MSCFSLTIVWGSRQHWSNTQSSSHLLTSSSFPSFILIDIKTRIVHPKPYRGSGFIIHIRIRSVYHIFTILVDILWFNSLFTVRDQANVPSIYRKNQIQHQESKTKSIIMATKTANIDSVLSKEGAAPRDDFGFALECMKSLDDNHNVIEFPFLFISVPPCCIWKWSFILIREHTGRSYQGCQCFELHKRSVCR